MPSVKSSRELAVLGPFANGDGGGVEGRVRGVTELFVAEFEVGWKETIAKDLDLWLGGEGVQVRMQDGFGGESGTVAVRLRRGVEAVGKGVLSGGGEVVLIFNDNDLVGIKSFAEGGEVGI